VVTVLPASLQAALADRYLIERELGRGGMATVYLARDLKHRRPIALKVLGSHFVASLGPDRFLREIELAARLQHPHILTVFDSGEVNGTLWFTMPYIEGESLRDRLRRERQLPLTDALRIATEVARALDYAHERGVIHRDIKPENLLLTSDGSTLVADFGIARALGETGELTETGIVVGTPTYMSPEQAAGERALDARTDIYSLGCVLYEMLAGEPPFTGINPQALLAKRLSTPAPALRTAREVPVGIDRALARALARLPADRYPSAGDLSRALQSAGETTADGRAATASGRPWGRRRPAIAVAALVLLVGAAVLMLWLRAPAADHVVPPSTAVLPFADLSPGRDQEYFVDGLTEELITALSRVDGVRVAARTSSFQFKGRQVDVREVGRRLDVGSVLEGSVRRSGNRARISAQLVSARDGYQLWADAYDRDLADVFGVQEEIARAIIAALRVRLGVRDSTALRTRPTSDLEAHELYLRGRFAWNQRTAGGMREAVKYLEQAVARDSAFGVAWAALADAYVLVVPYAGASRETTWPKAQAAAARALALDSTLAEAHTALAYGSMIYDWNWTGAEASFRRAIAVDPGYPTGHQWYADFLWGRGRLDEALREMQTAYRLDPLSLVIGGELGATYYRMRRYEEAETQLRMTLALDPNYAHTLYILGQVMLQQGRPREALDTLRRAEALGGFQEDLAGAIAWAYAAAGDSAGAARYTTDLEQRLARGTVGPFALALAYAGQGKLDRAFAYLHRSIDEKDIFLPEDFFEPLLDPMRADPRFAPVEQRMGIRPRT
jgi:TolB-like protein/Tfp pilus assembly protein PilF/predicted Ser/Thr protein kinase